MIIVSSSKAGAIRFIMVSVSDLCPLIAGFGVRHRKKFRVFPSRSALFVGAFCPDQGATIGARPALSSNEQVPAMQVPAEIAFHNVESSASTEVAIRDHIARLDRIYDRMTTCRVRVDQRNQNSSGTIPPVVHIEIVVPGHRDIVVSHEAGHLQRKYQSPDLHNAVNEAFRIAETQLAKFKDRRLDRAVEQTHEAAREFIGQVAEVTPGKDFGFLMTKEGGLLYFHRNSVLSGHFDDFSRGDDVTYVEEMGDTGPIASKVRGAHAR
jgi:ribosome-associated translation inhibitor RaiA/cold shock CspA family protein